MSIVVEFTTRDTIRVTCGDQVGEFPLPERLRGKGPGVISPAPAQPVADPAADPIQTVLPREREDPPLGRPKVGPGVAGIITNTASGEPPASIFDDDLLPDDGLTVRPIIAVAELRTMALHDLRRKILVLRAGAVAGASPFYLDLDLGAATINERLQLDALQQLIGEGYGGLAGIRLLRLPGTESD